ncbi:MAG TPA: hypothetical protein VGM23_11070 [Armatimonadota bacterium]|jgi:hypothetical protein
MKSQSDPESEVESGADYLSVGAMWIDLNAITATQRLPQGGLRLFMLGLPSSVASLDILGPHGRKVEELLSPRHLTYDPEIPDSAVILRTNRKRKPGS